MLVTLTGIVISVSFISFMNASSYIVFVPLGITTFSIDGQSLNVRLAITVSPVPKFMVLSFSQFINAPEQISVTLSDNVTVSSRSQFAKAYSPINLQPSGISTFVNASQLLKAELLIFSSFAGSLTSARLTHCPKASFSIIVIPSGRLIVSSEEQP